MRSSTSQFDQPIPLSKIRPYFDSWYAIRDGIHLDDFLERYKCIYQSKYRRSLYPLPSEIVIEDGAVKEIVNFEFELILAAISVMIQTARMWVCPSRPN